MSDGIMQNAPIKALSSDLQGKSPARDQFRPISETQNGRAIAGKTAVGETIPREQLLLY